MKRPRTALTVAALALLLGACGQKGPLYLPSGHKAPVVPTPGAATPHGVPPEATPLGPAAPPATEGGTGAASPAGTSAQPSQPQQPSRAPRSPPSSQSPQHNDSHDAPAEGAPADGPSPAA